MNRYVGEGILVNVSSYSKEGVTYFHYDFLVGDQEDGKPWIKSCSVEGYTTDHVAVKSPAFMQKVKIACVIREYFVKGQGKVRQPVYEVLDQ